MAAVALLLAAGTVLAAKPADNKAGAQKYAWHLSGDVMPVPPYGSADIAGSDTASKLIVNQPNGKVQSMVTGDMNGLHPNTTYTVYLSSGYMPYKETGWSLDGSWNLNFNSTKWPSGNPYAHTLTVNGNAATGSSTGNSYDATISVVGDDVTITAEYLFGSAAYPYTYTATGTIASMGTLSGTWSDTMGDSGTWNSTSGNATKMYTGDTGFSGLLSGVSPFTFTTDSEGSGSWHYNFRGVVNTLSAWINEAGRTILISDSISF